MELKLLIFSNIFFVLIKEKTCFPIKIISSSVLIFILLKKSAKLLLNVPHKPFWDPITINNDLLLLKKCLLRINKLFSDNHYGDIREFIHECVLST